MTRALWWSLTILVIGVGGYALMFALLPGFAENSAMKHHFADRPFAMYGHFLFGPVALIIGMLQFGPTAPGLRAGWHRVLGRIYVACCILAGVAGIKMSFDTIGGAPSGVGFFLLGIFWLMTTAVAFYHARVGRYAEHRRWMIRSYSLTFAAVTLRLQLGVLIPLFGYDFKDVYVLIAWGCWVPNILWAEWYVRRSPSITRPRAPAS